MPHKDQSRCYRVINGVRYVNWCDVHGEEERRIVYGVKLHKLPHRLLKHPHGFKILFVAESVPLAFATAFASGQYERAAT